MPKNHAIDVRANLDAGKYKNKLALVGTSIKPERLRKLEKLLGGEMTTHEFAEMQRLQASFQEQLVLHRASLDAYRKEDGRLTDLLEADCAAEKGLTDHPMRSKLWSKAWEHGHGNGLEEVYWWYTDLAELLEVPK